MILRIDPQVEATALAAFAYWQAVNAELAERLTVAFDQALARIEAHPEQGRPCLGLPQHYRRMRLAKHLPAYQFYYRYEAAEALVYLLRHERQRPYAPSTLRRKASEAARRLGTEQAE